MENEKVWEQPNELDNVPVADAKVDDSTPSSNQNGSQYGKFKDAESLLSAYNNLQAEFTRKCQKLSELENKQQQEEEKASTPIYLKDDWQDKVSNFLSNNQGAKKFASEISQEILTNPSLKNEENALDIAWAKIVSQKYKQPEEVLNDDKFVNDFVLNNEQIKQKILSNYIKNLESKKIPPFVSTSQGGNIAFQTTKQASTLSEAKQLVEAILNKRGD